ncbi:hypothetical protein CEXT_128371 [Caerostris extrusa]|uniref:Uncharacterized protein n=1 Tax=Caerostris extrusa TaxID=172846 RepID=A0AAV4XRR5_CAEEX|nr:hypothetical protein CEXT_128371 [Caerostris extrusa]
MPAASHLENRTETSHSSPFPSLKGELTTAPGGFSSSTHLPNDNKAASVLKYGSNLSFKYSSSSYPHVLSLGGCSQQESLKKSPLI